MKKNKDFDCVAMKRSGAEKIYEHTRNMTLLEELCIGNNKQKNYGSDRRLPFRGTAKQSRLTTKPVIMSYKTS